MSFTRENVRETFVTKYIFIVKNKIVKDLRFRNSLNFIDFTFGKNDVLVALELIGSNPVNSITILMEQIPISLKQEYDIIELKIEQDYSRLD